MGDTKTMPNPIEIEEEQPNDSTEELGEAKDLFPEIKRMMALGIPENVAEDIAFSRYEAKYGNLYITTYQGGNEDCYDFCDKEQLSKRLAIDISDNLFDSNFNIRNIIIGGKRYGMSIEISERLEPKTNAVIGLMEGGYMTYDLNKDINTGKFIIAIGKNCVVMDDKMKPRDVITRISMINEILNADDKSIFVFFKGMSVVYSWTIKLMEIM